MSKRCGLLALVLCLCTANLVFPQATELGTDLDALRATENFRLGLQAYNRNSFNEAILAFEQALSAKPGEPLLLDWLGRAYYRSGFENIALRQWQAAVQSYGVGSPEALLVNTRIEMVGNRRSLIPSMIESDRYVEIGSFPGTTPGGISLFSNPSAVLPQDDGGVLVVCYGSNEVVRLDVNGIVRERFRGSLGGFDRPYDIVRGLDGRLYVSEFRGGRISVLSANGVFQSHIGSKGIKGGELSGAGSLAVDDEGYLYVVEYGNRRVSKFSPDGEYLTSFGQRSVEFAGFLSPTGIAVTGDRVFVADNISKKIFTFDKNGMYLGILVGDGLFQPESLKIYPDGNLIVADTSRLLLVDIDSSVVKELCPPENSRVRYTSAQTGANGCIFAANFNAGEVAVLSALDDVASGFFVQIDRTVSMDFPLVTLEVSVQDRNRRPITGLTNSNFVLSEGGHPLDIQQFVAAGITQDEADVTVLVERSQTAGRARGELGAAMRDIEAAMSGRIRAIISAGREPVRESFSITNPASMQTAVQGAAASFTGGWRFDMGLRLAATELLPLSKKRAVIFITTGSVGELAFERYSLSELAAYMANNGITFYAVLVGGNEAGEELKYLCRETGGAAVQLYTPQGIAPVLRKLLNKPTGSYTLRYSTGLQTNFGRAFLPIEAEVYLLERSGRDNVGYFPPLE